MKKHKLPPQKDCFWKLFPLFTLIGCLPLLSLLADSSGSLPACSSDGDKGGCEDGECKIEAAVEVDALYEAETKYGLNEFTTEGLPASMPPKYYLKYTFDSSYNYDSTADYAGGGCGWWGCCYYSQQDYVTAFSGDLQIDMTYYPTNRSQAIVIYGGSAVSYHTNIVNYEEGNCPEPWTNSTPFVQYSYYYTGTCDTNGTWTGDASYASPYNPLGLQNVTTSNYTRTLIEYVGNQTNEYHYTDTNASPPVYQNSVDTEASTWKEVLTNEYTTPMLLADTLTKLNTNVYADWWSVGERVAYLRVNPYNTNETGVNFDNAAEARKFKLRVSFQTESNIDYKITWTVTGGPAPGDKDMIVTGDGSYKSYPIGEFVPSTNYPSIAVSEPKVAYHEPEEDAAAAGGDVEVESFSWKANLGKAGPRRGAGSLLIKEELPSAAIATPAKLRYLGATNGVDLITDGVGWLRQVLAPQCLADVVTTSTNAYEIRFYAATNSGVLTNGLYAPTGSPYTVWAISQPATNNTNLFRVVETRGASAITNDFEWSSTNSTWALVKGNGLRKITRTEVWSGAVLTITRSVINPVNNALVSKSVQKQQAFPFGLSLIESSIGDGAATRTTTRTYYTDPQNDGDNYGKLKTVVNPDGSWQWHEYGTNGLVARTYSSFLNQAPTNSAPLCRMTEYHYAPVGSGDDGSIQPQSPRTIVVKLLNTEVARSYAVYQPHEKSQIRCQTANAGWDASDNLVTTTTTYSSGSFKGWTKSVRRPDGTMSLHEYSVDGAGNLSTLVWSGQPNGGGTAILAGTKVVTLRGPLGNVIERTTVDIASDIITGSEVFSSFDEFGRPGRVTYLDSTFKLFSYLCCGLDSETDRDGVTTTYGYDALKRRITSTRNGISHIQTLDAANRVLFTQRQGTNASTITLASMVYDTAGRLLYQTNAVGNLTSFGQSIDGSGQTVKTTTNALGGTRIETYFKDGSLKSLTGTAAHGVRYDYGLESDLPYIKEIKLLTNGTDSAEWTKTFMDIAGRSFKTVYPDSAYTQSYYNNAGQLWKQRDADGVVTLYAYNGEGQVEYTALDMDRNDAIDFAGTDRITRVVRDVVAAHSTNVRRSRTYVWTTESSTNSLLTSTVEAAVDGTRTWQTAFGLTSQSVLLCGGTCAATNIAPDGSYTTSVKTNGYLMVVTRYDSLGTQLGATTFTYDEHGRSKTMTDARNGTSTLIYDDADRRVSKTTPIPASGQSAQTTTTYFDDLGRVWKTVQPDGTSVTNEYHLTMEPKKTYGSRVYPEERGYDYSGRMKTLKTWQSFATDTGAAVTTWNYSTNRGWLVSKQYADSQGPSYSYTAGGKLATRTWARTVTTTYAYNDGGDLTGLDYSDSTPDVGFFYDRRGRQTGATNANDAITYVHNDAGQLVAEVHGAGVLDGLAVTNTYDHLLRRTNLSAFNASTGLTTTAYGYDYASRLASVSDGTNSAHYGYLANSALVESIAFKQSGTTRMTTTKGYDYLNRLTGITSTSAVAAVSFAYAYNDANQRTRVDEADGSYWLYEYDALGQVTSAKRYASGGYIMPGQQHEYTYDDIGNRKTAKGGGNQFGTNLRESTYGVNALNQYTNRTVPGYIEVQGSAASNATVTVNNESTTRQGAYYRKELTINNSPSAVWQNITNIAVLNFAGTNGEDVVTIKTGNALVPKTPEAFTYDADGNLTADGRFTYTWDAENRLLQVESLTNAPTGAKVKVAWTYDARSRRIQQQSYTEQSGTLVLTSNLKFLADGWRHIAELNATNNAPLKAYAWGLDLSGSLDGAGGVGGLLFFRDTSTHFTAYDGNGNVRALFSANDGTLTAQYDYDAFGNILRATGSVALANPFRFSTKRMDDLTSLLLYEYRAYAPWLGRWLNRDLIEEIGGLNLVGAAANNLINSVDPLGLSFGFANPEAALFTFKAIGYEEFASVYGIKAAQWGLGLLAAAMAAEAAKPWLDRITVAKTDCPDPCKNNKDFNAISDKFKNVVNSLWKPLKSGSTVIGDGGAIDAALHTAATGELVGGSDHKLKLKEASNALKTMQNSLNQNNKGFPPICQERLRPMIDELKKLIDDALKTIGGS